MDSLSKSDEQSNAIHAQPLPDRGKNLYQAPKGFLPQFATLGMDTYVGRVFLIPWLNIDGRQAVWFDLAERKFHIFWITLWPQDMPFLAALLIIAAFALFTITNLLGQVWCGFFCPQTVWTGIFIAIEDWFEGDRNGESN